MSPPVEAPQEHKKKSRRRLRVSCVECTRRRQKCDRQQPCALCRSRGVESLCRFELEPFARPTPARPPHKSLSKSASRSAGNGDSEQSMARLAQLATPAPVTSQNYEEPVVDQEVKEAAIALAQLSVARKGEYLGVGSIICALHRLDQTGSVLIDYDKSILPYFGECDYSSTVKESFDYQIDALVYSLPPREHCNVLLAGYFQYENWRYNLPRTLIMSMCDIFWDAVQRSQARLPSCKIRANWLSLLFSMFAVSPSCVTEQESKKYFLHALTGRRLAEDKFISAFSLANAPFSVTEGVALGCAAVVLLANYLCDRGQVTEAWKLVGTAVRNAQNAGMHVNPQWTKWKNMDEDEQILRRTAWILLSQTDKFLSSVLGRPSIIRLRDSNVPYPEVPLQPLAIDGSSDTSTMYQVCLARLLDIVGDVRDKYLALEQDPTVKDKNPMDSFNEWKRTLPPCFAFQQPDTTRDHLYPNLLMQRCSLCIQYFASTILFLRTLANTRSPILQAYQPSCVGGTESLTFSYAEPASMAVELLAHLQAIRIYILMGPRRQPCFASNFFIVEAAITLVVAIRTEPFNVQVPVWRSKVQGAISMLEERQPDDNGNIVRQSIQALRVLQGAIKEKDDNTVPAMSAAVHSPTVFPSFLPEFNIPFEWQAPLGSVAMNGESSDPSISANDHSQWPQAQLPEWMLDGANNMTAFDLLHMLQQP